MRGDHGIRFKTWEHRYAGYACGKAGNFLQLEQVRGKVGKIAWGLMLEGIECQNEELGCHTKIAEEWGDMIRAVF